VIPDDTAPAVAPIGTPQEEIRRALSAHGYIFLTIWDGGARSDVHHKQIEKYIHPRTGKLFVLEPMHEGGLELYESTPGRTVAAAVERITAGARRD
jgi:hypothetical protein